jgi:N-acetylmuramic acid 6-phosphate (MurNAc-6-P) etherase
MTTKTYHAESMLQALEMVLAELGAGTPGHLSVRDASERPAAVVAQNRAWSWWR